MSVIEHLDQRIEELEAENAKLLEALRKITESKGTHLWNCSTRDVCYRREGVKRGLQRMSSEQEISRRARIDQFCPAEKAIYDAMQAVEVMPASVHLTQAVILLGQAREKVADFVDGLPEPDMTAQINAGDALNKALLALYLMVDETVAKDVSDKVYAAFSYEKWRADRAELLLQFPQSEKEARLLERVKRLELNIAKLVEDRK